MNQELGQNGELNEKICSIILIIVTVLGLSSCSNQTKKIVFYPELVCYNLNRSDSANEFSFNMNVKSSDKNPKIEFISAEGINTENLMVTFSNDTFENIADERIKGSYIILLGVHCCNVTEYTRIDSMKLMVNNIETEIQFSTPVENTFYNYDETEHILSQRNMPIYVFPQSFVGYNETDYTFSLEAIENTFMNSFKFNDFLEFSNAEVFINDKFVGNLKDVFPLELKKGDIFTVKSRIAFEDEKYSGMENLYLNIVAECNTNGKLATEYYPMVATYIGNLDDAKEFIKDYEKT